VSDIFDLQDQIAEEVAGALEPKLIWAEAARTRAKPTESLTAYELCLRAAPLVSRMDTPDNLDEGLRLLREALQRDPGYVQAKALLLLRPYRGVATRSWSFEQARAALDTALGGRERGAGRRARAGLCRALPRLCPQPSHRWDDSAQPRRAAQPELGPGSDAERDGCTSTATKTRPRSPF
jgi:hypothetical protein